MNALTRLGRLVLVGSSLATGLGWAGEELAAVGKLAPAFRLPAYNAKIIGAASAGLDDFVGSDPRTKDVRVLLVSFMASFCGPCKEELPYLQALYASHQPQGLRILMVAIDKDEPGQKKVSALINEHKVSFPVLKDRFNIVARRWLGTESPLPSLFLVRPDGVVSVVHRGYNEDLGTVVSKEVSDALGTK